MNNILGAVLLVLPMVVLVAVLFIASRRIAAGERPIQPSSPEPSKEA
jgi:hypothetical protein